MRDITLEETAYFNFTTRAFATGVPTTLAGTPVLSVLESNNATPITAGVSVSVDRATVTGLNQATVVATAANGYEAGKSYAVYISTGTVGGTSVVGEVVAEFTVQASAAFTRLGAPAGASVSADVAAVKVDTAAAATQALLNTVAGYLDTEIAAILADTNELQLNQGNWLTATGFAVAGDPMALTAGERTTLTAAIWAYVITGTTTAVQAMRGFIAAMLGKASGLPTAPKYRNVADTKNVISATTDADGNRTAVTLDLS